MLAKDIMTSQVITIRQDATIEQAARMMYENHFHGMPVIDDNSFIVGMITELDLIRYAQKTKVVPLRSPWAWVSPYANVDDLASFKQGLLEIAGTKVKDVMTRKVINVSPETPVEDIAGLMVKWTINRVPVVDSCGQLVGIITRSDIVKAISLAHKSDEAVG